MDLLRDKKFLCDVTLVCEGGEIPAHRIVLSSSCLYFQAKFTNLLEDKFELKGIEVKPLLNVLHYIYTGRFPCDLDNDVTSLKAILVLSDFLQLFHLAEYCRQCLVRNMNLDNCLNLLDVSDSCIQCDELQKYAGKNFDRLQSMSQFQYLNASQMTTLMNCARECDQSSDVILQGLLQWVKYNTEARINDMTKLIHIVEIDKVSTGYLQMLTNDLLVRNCVDLAHFLFKCAVNRLYENEYSSKHVSPSSNNNWKNYKIEFINCEKRNFNQSYYHFTYYYDDELWSDIKALNRISGSKICSFCTLGNYIYFFEKMLKNLVAFHRFHIFENDFHQIEFPYERSYLYSVADFNEIIYLHVSSNLICYHPNGEWETVCTNLPNSPTVLVSCLQYLYCIGDSQNIIRYNPASKTYTTFMIPKMLKVNHNQKISPCSERIFFFDQTDNIFIIYDCKTNEWSNYTLPMTINQLGNKWDFCSVKKELSSLIFIDEFKLLWKFYPENERWKRMSSDPKFVTNISEIFVRR